jgi:hypothetical protein
LRAEIGECAGLKVVANEVCAWPCHQEEGAVLPIESQRDDPLPRFGDAKAGKSTVLRIPDEEVASWIRPFASRRRSVVPNMCSEVNKPAILNERCVDLPLRYGRRVKQLFKAGNNLDAFCSRIETTETCMLIRLV